MSTFKICGLSKKEKLVRLNLKTLYGLELDRLAYLKLLAQDFYCLWDLLYEIDYHFVQVGSFECHSKQRSEKTRSHLLFLLVQTANRFEKHGYRTRVARHICHCRNEFLTGLYTKVVVLRKDAHFDLAHNRLRKQV